MACLGCRTSQRLPNQPGKPIPALAQAVKQCGVSDIGEPNRGSPRRRAILDEASKSDNELIAIAGIAQIADRLDVSIDWLLGRSNVMGLGKSSTHSNELSLCLNAFALSTEARIICCYRKVVRLRGCRVRIYCVPTPRGCESDFGLSVQS